MYVERKRVMEKNEEMDLKNTKREKEREREREREW